MTRNIGRPDFLNDYQKPNITFDLDGARKRLKGKEITMYDELVVPTDQEVAFDEAGLQLLTNLDAPIEFQGRS